MWARGNPSTWKVPVGKRLEVYIWTLVALGFLAGIAGHGTWFGPVAFKVSFSLVGLWAILLVLTAWSNRPCRPADPECRDSKPAAEKRTE